MKSDGPVSSSNVYNFRLTVDIYLTRFRQNKLSQNSTREESGTECEVSICE